MTCCSADGQGSANATVMTAGEKIKRPGAATFAAVNSGEGSTSAALGCGMEWEMLIFIGQGRIQETADQTGKLRKVALLPQWGSSPTN